MNIFISYCSHLFLIRRDNNTQLKHGVNTISKNISKTSGVKFTIGTLGKTTIDKF